MKRDNNNSHKKRVLFVASAGGHLTETLALSPIFKNYDYLIVTEHDKTNINSNDWNIKYLKYCTRKKFFSYVFLAPINIIKSINIFFKFKPETIVSTGAHTVIPMIILGKIFHKKTIHIETFANIESKTLTGKIIYPLVDVFIVQWPNMLNLYPKAKYYGGVF